MAPFDAAGPVQQLQSDSGSDDAKDKEAAKPAGAVAPAAAAAKPAKEAAPADKAKSKRK